MQDIDFDGAQLKICCDCIDKLWMVGKPEKLKKVQHSTMYRTYGLEEGKEEVQGTVLGDGGKYVSIIPVVYPCDTVSVSSLDYFSSVSFSSKPSHPSLPVYIGAATFKSF